VPQKYYNWTTLKTCRYCHKQYPETDFGVAATLPNKVYRRQKCRYCYGKTKRLLIVRYRKWLECYKREKQCERCGVADFRVLDFHHGGSTEKDFNVSDFRYRAGFARLKEEVKKCTLLCANCHRIVHFKENNK
jgi:hypothetical protein